MRLRRLGRTGLSVSELTLGTIGLRESGVDPADRAAAVALALASGINAVEVETGDDGAGAPIGEILRRIGGRHQLHVLSRVRSLVRFDLPSPHVHAQQAYPGAHIRTETDGLLRRLGIERLAVQQLHAWCPEWLHEGDWLETLGRLREEGKIAGIGISLFDHDIAAGLEAVSSGAIDAVQVMYNVFDPGAAAELFPLCRQHDVAVIARSPFYYGALSERIASPSPFRPGDWRRPYFYEEHLAETRARVARLAAAFAGPDVSVSSLALRFSLSHPAIATVAAGMLTRRHVEANVNAVAEGPLGLAQLAALQAHKWLC
jgi:aryl-alcohol dehydrogenase-like predicted oxidoreductase